MNFDFIARVRHELRITISALEETVIAVAERVNRKVQLLRLHWQASQIHQSLAGVYRDLGHQLSTAASSEELNPLGSTPTARTGFTLDIQASLVQSDEQARTLKRQLDRLESRIVTMQSEVLREDLLRFTRELEVRGLTIQYLIVARGSQLAGRSIRDAVPTSDMHLTGVVRGPLVLGPHTTHPLQPGDGILILGPPHDVANYAQLAAGGSRALPQTAGLESLGHMSS